MRTTESSKSYLRTESSQYIQAVGKLQCDYQTHLYQERKAVTYWNEVNVGKVWEARRSQGIV